MKTFSTLLGLSTLVSAAPLLNTRDPNVVPGRYVVVYKKGQDTAGNLLKDHIAGGAVAPDAVHQTFSLPGFSGFAASLSADQLTTLKSDARVAYLEADGIAHTQIVAGSLAQIDQTGAPWGLGRISHRAKGSTEYLYDDAAGEGACAYVIDTGITPDAPELEGRATMVKSFISGATKDDNGHGTHVSGTIASKTYGVAKKAKVYGIKVLDSDGSGAWSDIISGIQTAVDDSKTRDCPKGIVVNMSLGGSKSQSVNDAAAAMVDAGLFLAVAAGNENADYHTSSPASEPKAFAVGASDISDKMASFSNYGAKLGIIAPGVDVESIWNDGTVKTISGTSMATPHVVGLAAYIASLSPTKLSVADLKSQLQSLATTKAVTLPSAARYSTPNLLAFNGVGSSTQERDEVEEDEE